MKLYAYDLFYEYTLIRRGRIKAKIILIDKKPYIANSFGKPMANLYKPFQNGDVVYSLYEINDSHYEKMKKHRQKLFK